MARKNKIYKNLRQIFLILAVSSIVYIAIALFNRFFSAPSIAFCGALIVFIVLLVQWKRSKSFYQEIDFLKHALNNIDSAVIPLESLSEPLRNLDKKVDVKWDRGMIAPDLANYLIQKIYLTRPEKILECGIGLSTQIIGECLKNIGKGNLVGLEHDPQWVQSVSKLLEEKQIDDRIEIISAPLQEYHMENREFQWYSRLEQIKAHGPFDLVFVDGPPAFKPTDPGRIGALFALKSSIKSGGILLLDDGGRPGEQTAVQEWIKVYGSGIKAEYVDLKKGLWVVEII